MELTAQQSRVAVASGNFLLLACPGSGKTRSAAARVGTQVAAGRKLAVCSYTNVGADRIRAVIGDTGTALGPEHFVGTLHAFLLRYVVYPFGYLAGAGTGPRLLDTAGGSVAYQGDQRKRIAVADFRRRPDGGLKLKTRPVYLSSVDEGKIVHAVEGDVLAAKRAALKAGYVSFDDAIYVALWLLRKHRYIARAVAKRFDELVLDEAQDTSELQLACIHELKSAGLDSLVLVGDLEQSIFSFQGASADGCRDLANKHGLPTIELTENHRCSQRICDVAVHFCERSQADLAVGTHADCPISPEVILYPPADPSVAVEMFRRRLEEHGSDPGNAAVLARGNALVDELNGCDSPIAISDRSSALGHAAAALKHGSFTRRHLHQVQRIVASAAWEEESLEALPREMADRLRAESVRFLTSLPGMACDLRTWIKAAATLLTETAARLNSPPAKAGGRLLQSKAEHAGVSASDVFVAQARQLSAQTIHDIKGEDREAVLVVLDRPRSRKRDAQAQLWSSALAGQEIDAAQAEEKRIAFVALTRAQRICVVALPDDHDGRGAADAFVAKGFALYGSTQ